MSISAAHCYKLVKLLILRNYITEKYCLILPLPTPNTQKPFPSVHWGGGVYERSNKRTLEMTQRQTSTSPAIREKEPIFTYQEKLINCICFVSFIHLYACTSVYWERTVTRQNYFWMRMKETPSIAYNEIIRTLKLIALLRSIQFQKLTCDLPNIICF